MSEDQQNDRIASFRNIRLSHEQQQKKIIFYYVFFFASLIIAIIPFTIASIFSFMICICTLSGLYSTRSIAEEDSLIENQMTFLIRTFWRVNLYLIFTGVFALLYMAFFAEYSSLKPCVNTFNRHFTYISNNFSIEIMDKVSKGCRGNFIKDNYNHLIITALIAFGPILFYLLKRCITGLMFVRANILIPDEKL